jgi:hypothetical protein
VSFAQQYEKSSALLGRDGKEGSRHLLNFAALAFGASRPDLFVFGDAQNQGEPLVALFAHILVDWH